MDSGTTESGDPRLTAADLIETLYHGLADNTVGKIIDTLLRADLLICDEIGFAPLDDTGRRLQTPLAGHRVAPAPVPVIPSVTIPARTPSNVLIATALILQVFPTDRLSCSLGWVQSG
ncbi:MAG: putative insertion sequence ATP-binding protein [Mycobacterium sp.]|jgi:hypothetical protein|nr:putative insertion sequence ATP-binding protein [Mycobacterium sp.]